MDANLSSVNQMISLDSSRLSPPSAASLSSKPPLTSTLCPLHKFHHRPKPNQRRIRNGIFKAELSQDAPLAVAIGACVLNSLVFPIIPEPDDEDDDGEESPVISTTDARFAVMGIISFIPYFNWTSWVFAWLDTGKQRYLVYSLVYLAPYLRTNLSLSPEESWLPIASILFCIIHIQLEASIRNGDLQGFQLFRRLADNQSITAKRKRRAHGHDSTSEEEQAKEYMNLPSAQDQSRKEIQGWGVPERPSSDAEQSNEDEDASNRRKH